MYCIISNCSLHYLILYLLYVSTINYWNKYCTTNLVFAMVMTYYYETEYFFLLGICTVIHFHCAWLLINKTEISVRKFTYQKSIISYYIHYIVRNFFICIIFKILTNICLTKWSWKMFMLYHDPEMTLFCTRRYSLPLAY